ncbi:MAG: F0F1 ATP synthase subunit alpha, partial [Armatimonadetes bacterium CG07_land_8_20_14_0_80_40_9]
MEIKPAEVSSVIEREIEKFEKELKMESVGVVLQVGDGIARVYGLSQAMAGELIEFPGEVYGITLNLEEDNVGCVLLGEDTHIKEGDQVSCTGRIIQVPVGEALLGRVVNPLGQPLDGKGEIVTKKSRLLEGRAPSVIERQP